ncbi:hypothetical protein BD408DRAFT_329106, partial [Parasitella parasitica]
MESVKSKRFSFAGFSSSLSRSLSFGGPAAPHQSADAKATKRAQKSKSLYMKSFKKVDTKEPPIKATYDASEAVQSNSKDVRNSIRRSLSAVIYASPHKGEGDNKLVPVLVTPDLSESVGGILVNDKPAQEENKTTASKADSTEYDNTLEVFYSQKQEENDKSVTILWQGYGYMYDNKGDSTLEELQQRFEKDVWTTYCGLIHPLHLVADDNERNWEDLSVNELRQYYDNYGSMMLKIRESRMLKQQKQY